MQQIAVKTYILDNCRERVVKSFSLPEYDPLLNQNVGQNILKRPKRILQRTTRKMSKVLYQTQENNNQSTLSDCFASTKS